MDSETPAFPAQPDPAASSVRPAQPAYGAYGPVPPASVTAPMAAPAAAGSTLGGRILSWVVALLVGALFGVLGTVCHTVTLSLFGLSLPIGLIVALPAVALLLVGLRMISASRWPSILAALGLVVMVGLFTLPSPGGSVLIQGITAGYVWLIGSFGIALVTVAWPRLSGGAASRRRSATN